MSDDRRRSTHLRTWWDYMQIVLPHPQPVLPAQGSAVCPVDLPHRILLDTSFLAVPSDHRIVEWFRLEGTLETI